MSKKIKQLEKIDNNIEAIIAFLEGSERFQNWYKTASSVNWQESKQLFRWGIKDLIIYYLEKEGTDE